MVGFHDAKLATLYIPPPSAAEARGGNGRQTYFVCWRSGSAFGAMVVVSASVGRGSMRDAKRAKALQLKKQQMEVRIQEQIEAWFLKFDVDGNNALEKDELRNLLTHLHPDKPADDAALENLMQMAGGASSIIPHGQQSISKEQCMKVRPASSRTCGLHRQGVRLTRVRSRRRPYKSTTATSRTGYSSTNSSARSTKTVRRKTFPDSVACPESPDPRSRGVP
jgi:hypothetical protein